MLWINDFILSFFFICKNTLNRLIYMAYYYHRKRNDSILINCAMKTFFANVNAGTVILVSWNIQCHFCHLAHSILYMWNSQTQKQLNRMLQFECKSRLIFRLNFFSVNCMYCLYSSELWIKLIAIISQTILFYVKLFNMLFDISPIFFGRLFYLLLDRVKLLNVCVCVCVRHFIKNQSVNTSNWIP